MSPPPEVLKRKSPHRSATQKENTNINVNELFTNVHYIHTPMQTAIARRIVLLPHDLAPDATRPAQPRKTPRYVIVIVRASFFIFSFPSCPLKALRCVIFPQRLSKKQRTPLFVTSSTCTDETPGCTRLSGRARGSRAWSRSGRWHRGRRGSEERHLASLDLVSRSSGFLPPEVMK